MIRLSDEELEVSLQPLPDWQRVAVDHRPGIRRVFATGTFMQGLLLVNLIAKLAEAAHHHPDVLLTYPRVVIDLTTHDAGGVTQADIDLAHQIESLLTPSAPSV